MRRRSAFAFFAAILFAGAARADLVPSGYKSVKLSVRVDADVPADKALILAHTFRAIDVIKPGTVAEVEWHPMAGKMVLVSVPASSVTAKVEEQRKSLEREPLEQIAKGGKPCHEGFDGVRTVPTSAPADEVRWVYEVTFSGESCAATLTKMEFFDSSGKAVDGTDVPNLPAVAATADVPASAASAPSPGKAPAGATAPGAAPGAPAPGELQNGACGCEVGPGATRGAAGTGMLAALGLLVAARRRRGDPSRSAARCR